MADQPASGPSSSASLSRLSIDRSAGPALRRRRPLWKRGGSGSSCWPSWRPRLSRCAGGRRRWRSRSPPSPPPTRRGPLAVLNATGRVVAARRASVSSKATGRLEWLGVQEGQRVKEGDVIARLENRDVAAQPRAGAGAGAGRARQPRAGPGRTRRRAGGTEARAGSREEELRLRRRARHGGSAPQQGARRDRVAEGADRGGGGQPPASPASPSTRR